jgi:RHS repeat-associated protein
MPKKYSNLISVGIMERLLVPIVLLFGFAVIGDFVRNGRADGCDICDCKITISGAECVGDCTFKLTFSTCSSPELSPYTFTSECADDDFESNSDDISWSASGSHGLNIGSDGTITGSPSAINPGTYTLSADDGNGHTRSVSIEVEVVECNCEAAGSSTMGTTSAANSSVAASFKLGKTAFGKSAGALRVKENYPTNVLSTPLCLRYRYPTNSDCEVITNSAGIRQVKVPEGLANVLTNGSTNVYFIEFYPASQVGSKVGGLYQLSGSPLTTNRIENPDGGTSTNRFRVTESDGSVCDYEWKTNGWELVTGNGWRKEYKASSWSGDMNYRTNTVEIRDTNTLVSSTIRKYQAFPWGQKLIEEVTGTGAATLTNTYTYYTNAGPTTGLVQQVNFADGRWEIREYDTNRYLTNLIVSFGNQAPTNNGDLCRRFEYSYATNVISGSGERGGRPRGDPRRTIEYLLGREIGRSYTVGLRGERRSIQCVTPGAAWNDASNLVTITKWYTNGVFKGKLWSVERPNGTMDIHTYAYYTNGSGVAYMTNIVSAGAPDASKSNIVSGTRTTTVLAAVNRRISKTAIDIESGIILGSEVYSEPDAYDRPRKATYLDGTWSWTEHSDCCGVGGTETNREGTVIYHYKDALKRQAATKKSDITATNVYDSAGKLLQIIRIGSDATKITNTVHTYDTLGRMLTSKDALGNTTTYTQTITNYQMIRTNTYPDGSTRVETYYRDGQLAKVTGTAVHPARYEYGVIQDDSVWRRYTKEIKLDGNGNDMSEVITNFFDMLRRNYETVYADGAKRESLYNTKGQLVKTVDADGVTMLYEYNARGELEYVVTDIDRDGVKDLIGPDRIRQTIRDVTTIGAGNVVRTRSYHWATNGSSISNLVSAHEVKTDDLIFWNSDFGVTNRSWTVYAGSGNQFETNTAPDGSYTITHFQHGQLKSVTQKDAGGSQLGQITYTYDAHGRNKTETDARNGTIIYTYDNADRLTSVTTPSAGAGQSPQTTSYSYDYAGRRTRTVMPDGATATNEYHASGELKKMYGARVHPVEYKYDAQGRQTNMTTWQNYSAGTGTANTAWKYDALRGFMTNKVYTDGAGPTYTYTSAGRVQTRTWARGIRRTNEFDNAGEIVGIKYSDGTSNVVYNLDRLGRRTNIVDGAGSRYLVYTESGLPLVETNASGVLAGVAITNGYDSFGRRTAIGMLTNGNSAFVHTYAYASASRLTNVSDGNYNATYSYLANSPLVSQITYRSNATTRMTTTKSHDYLNRLTQISSQPSAAGESPISFNYALNDANQRTRVTHADGCYWVYEYDELGQITSGKKYWEDGTPVAGQQFEYAYDDIGNRTSTKEGGDSSGGNLRSGTYSANLLNQYTNRTVSGTVDLIGIAKATATVNVNDQSTYRRGEYYQVAIANDNTSAIVYPGYTNRAILAGETNTLAGNLLIPKTPQAFWYDSDGNALSDGVWTNTWDAENRMSVTENITAVPSIGRGRESWSFDSEGRWVKRVVSTWGEGGYGALSTNRFVWDKNVLLAILAETPVIRASLMRGLDESGTFHGAGGAGGVIAVNVQTNGIQLCAYDGTANVVALAKGQDGKTGGSYEYSPFGSTVRLTGSAANENPMRFSSQFSSDVTDRVKYLYRDYQAGVGRWLSRDPIEENDGFNLYAYTRNRPTDLIDRLGLNCMHAGQPSSLNAVVTMNNIRIRCVRDCWFNTFGTVYSFLCCFDKVAYGRGQGIFVCRRRLVVTIKGSHYEYYWDPSGVAPGSPLPTPPACATGCEDSGISCYIAARQ